MESPEFSVGKRALLVFRGEREEDYLSRKRYRMGEIIGLHPDNLWVFLLDGSLNPMLVSPENLREVDDD